MAKMTLSGLQSFITTYITAAKQAGTWDDSTTSIDNMIDKIGKQIIIDGDFEDKLPELTGDDLPLGKTIEEWFIDLILPTLKGDGSQALAKSNPSFKDAAYSYPFDKMMVKTTLEYNEYNISALTEDELANIMTKVIERLENSESITRYFMKKQLLANLIAKAEAASNSANMVKTLAKPVDTQTGEAFIKQVKKDVEESGFATEGNNLGNCLIGSAPRMTLYVLKGVMPSIEVDTQAGCFNLDKISVPADLKVIDSFGNNATGVYAILIDPRGVKLHNTYRRARRQENAEGDYDNMYRHFQDTGFISKYTFVRVYKAS